MKTITNHKYKLLAATVGSNLKFCRLSRKLSMKKVGEALGVKFQQIQKYEDGKNQCSIYRMDQFAKLFGEEIKNFIDPNYISKMCNLRKSIPTLETADGTKIATLTLSQAKQILEENQKIDPTQPMYDGKIS